MIRRLRRAVHPVAASMLFLALCPFAAWGLEQEAKSPFPADVYLGPAPRLEPGMAPPEGFFAPAPKAVAAVPAINTADRAAVVAAYNTYFNLPMPSLGFTGSVPACNAGAISLAFQEWSLGRINFMRAMAGVSGNTTLDATRNGQQQAAALYMAANNTLTHAPAGGACFTQAAYDGASTSNLALGGLTDFIPLYMTDPGFGNEIAGHRRWILHSAKRAFGFGQASGGTNANALWVFDFGPAVSVSNGIAWPPRGYVPMALIPAPFGGEGQRWSFGLPNANFGAATVSLTLNGANVPVTVISRTDNGYGDNTIVWALPGGHVVAKDTTYVVTITGVTNAPQGTYSYQVLPFDPADPPPGRTLTVGRNGTGAGTVTSSAAGIVCGATCSATFNTGSTVSLVAAASGGSTFAGWSGACAGTGACNVTMDAAKSVTATFNTIGSPASVSASPSPVAFGGQSINTTAPAATVQITNTGGGTLNVTSIAASTHFGVTHNCTSLANGAGCQAFVTFTPGEQGSLFGTLTVTTSAGQQTFTITGTGERSLVTHYYRSILRRAPDAGGKSFWEGEATRVSGLGANVNETWFAMAQSFFGSAEYAAFGRDHTGFVTDLYNTFFNRAPDGAGLSFWVGQIQAGMPREVALVSFMFSTEFANFTQAIFGNAAVRAEVNTVVDFYRGLLSRLPDDSGFTFWRQQFRTAQCQGSAAVTAQAEAISSAFALSAEYAQRGRSNAQYVGDLYNAFLRRGGDLAGVQFWIGQIDTGARSRENVRQQFVASPEFQARVQAIIAAGCLP